MTHLVFLLIIKLASGARNGFHYMGKSTERNLLNTAIILLLLIYAMLVNGISPKLFYTMIPIAGLYLYGEFGFNKYLHWWESIVANLIYLIMILYGADMLMIPLTALFANIFFKGSINLAIGRSFIERTDGTDDNRGKTLGFPTPWGTLRRPRIANGYVSAAVGVVLATIWVIYIQFYYFDLQTVINIIVNLF
jgi:hypothetical protein